MSADFLRPLLLATVSGVTHGATLFLVAVGLSLIFGVLRILNVAHGSFYAIGAFMAASAWLLLGWLQLSPYLIYPALMVCALLVGIVLGPILERWLLRWTYAAGSPAQREYLQLLTTYAIFLVLENLQKLVWGVAPYYSAAALRLLGNSTIVGVPFTNYQLLLVPLAAAVWIALRWLLQHTVVGKFVIAVRDNPEMAASLGIDVGRVYILVFAIGSVLAALGGALSSPTIGVSIGIGAEMIVLSFAVVAVAGLGQIGGTAIAALIIGIAHALAVFFTPEFSAVMPYIIMVVVLLIRPHGLFGQAEKRRI